MVFGFRLEKKINFRININLHYLQTMKQLFTLSFCILFGNLFGQSNMTIFNNGGQQFYVILNGIKQNSVPQTNVVISGIKNGAYSAKLIFADGKTADIDKNFFIDEASDITTKVIFKKGIGKLQLVSMLPTTGVANGAVIYRQDNNVIFSDAPVVQTQQIQNQGTVTVNSTVPNTTTTIQSQPIQTQGTTTISTNVPTTTTSVQTNTTGTNSNISTNQNTNGNVNMNVNAGTNLNGNPNVGTVTTTTNPNQTNGSLNMNVGVTTNGMNVNMDPMNGQDGNINMNIGFNLNGANVNVTDPTIPSGNVNVNMNGSFPNTGNFQSTSTTSTSSTQTINGQTTHQSGSTTTQNNNGNVTVTTTGTPNMNGNVNVNNNGTVRPNNGNVTVTTNGNVIPSNGSVNLNTNGNVIPSNGNVTVTTNGNVIPNNGNVTVNANGNVVPNNGTVNASSNTTQSTTTFNNEVEANSNGECDITTNSNKSVICVSFLNNSKEFVDDLKTQSFEDDRIDIICKDLSKIYLTSAQVYQILETITFESSKYEVAKFLYVRTTDKQVLDKGLLPLFTFDSTKMDWREFTRIK